MIRLDQDLVRLNEELKKLVAEAEGLKVAPIANRGCAIFFAGTVGVLGVGFLIVGFQGQVESSGFATLLGLLMAGGSLVWLVKAWTTSTAHKVRAVQKQVAAKQTEIDRVKHRIAEQRRIVDAVR